MLVHVKVAPKARRERVQEGKGGVLEISVKEPAEGARANERVRELLALHFGVPVKKIFLIKGHRNPRKTYRIGA